MAEPAPSPDIRWKQRLHNFRKAFGQLKRAAELAKQRELSDLEKQGLIQAFEFTHELAWKTLKDFLEEQGETGIYGSRNATRKAFQRGLISDGEIWMQMIESRNSSTHTYNQETAAAIVTAIVDSYVAVLDPFERRFLDLEKQSS